MADALFLIAAFACSVGGMASFALAYQVHWKQAGGQGALSRAAATHLCVRGAIALALSLVSCLVADHVTMAALVWVMLNCLAAVLLALTLAYRPRSLRVLLVGSA